MKKLFFYACLFSSYCLGAAAQTTISSPSSSTVAFSTNNQIITIAAGGNITKTASPSAVTSNGLTGIQLIVNTNSGQGISNSDTDSSAIEINGGTLQNLTLNTGRITSAADNFIGTISIQNVVGNNSITTVSGTTISNTSTNLSSLINIDGISTGNLEITNARNS